MKDLEQIKETLKIQKAIEKELRDSFIAKLPEISTRLVTELFKLVMDSSKELRLALSPCIVLNYSDSMIYIRVLPIEAGARMDDSIKLRQLYPSYSLAELLEAKDYELYELKYRRDLCHKLAISIKSYLSTKDCGCSIREDSSEIGYDTTNTEYTIRLNIE